MKKQKKRALIIVAVCLVIAIGAFVADRMLSKSNLVEIKYSEMKKKIDDKDSFIVLFSQTTCSHCMDFKPKLEKVANDTGIKIYYLETDLLSEDEYTDLKKDFSFSGTPTTVFIINGEEKTAASRINGDVTVEKIIAKLKSNGFIDE